MSLCFAIGQTPFLPSSSNPSPRISSRPQIRHPSTTPRHTAPLCLSPPPSPTPNAIPTHYRLPFVGLLLDHVGIIPSRSLNALATRLGPVYRSYISSEVGIVVTSHALVDEILSQDAIFACSDASLPVFEELFGERLPFNITGAAHAAVRGSLAPAFAPALFPVYFAPIFRLSKKVWARAAAATDADASVAMFPLMRRHFLEVITTITAGISETHPSFEAVDKRFIDFVNGLGTVPFGPVWDAAVRAKDQLLDILIGVAEERLRDRQDIILAIRAELAEKVDVAAARYALKSGDMLTMFLACTELHALPEGGERPKEEALVLFTIASDLLVLWFAGFETNSSLTSSALFEMMRRPDVVSTLAQEQDCVWEGLGENGADVDAQLKAFMGQMPLLASYTEEVNRLHSPVGYFFRRALEDTVIGKLSGGGYHIPKGTIVLLDTSSAGKDPSVYSSPTELDMRRFLSEPGKPASKKTFGYGGLKSPHVCLGMALSKLAINITLGTGLREYSLNFVEGQDMSYRKLPFCSPKSGAVARVEPRA